MTPDGAAGSAVAALLRSGKITESEATAAERWYRDYALGVHGVFDAEFSGAGGGDAHTAGFARAKAARAYSQACVAVGGFLTGVLSHLVIKQMSLGQMAEAFGFNAHVMCGVAVAAIRRLAEHYADADKAIFGPSHGKIRSADFSS